MLRQLGTQPNTTSILRVTVAMHVTTWLCHHKTHIITDMTNCGQNRTPLLIVTRK